MIKIVLYSIGVLPVSVVHVTEMIAFSFAGVKMLSIPEGVIVHPYKQTIKPMVYEHVLSPSLYFKALFNILNVLLCMQGKLVINFIYSFKAKASG